MRQGQRRATSPHHSCLKVALLPHPSQPTRPFSTGFVLIRRKMPPCSQEAVKWEAAHRPSQHCWPTSPHTHRHTDTQTHSHTYTHTHTHIHTHTRVGWETAHRPSLTSPHHIHTDLPPHCSCHACSRSVNSPPRRSCNQMSLMTQKTFSSKVRRWMRVACSAADAERACLFVGHMARGVAHVLVRCCRWLCPRAVGLNAKWRASELADLGQWKEARDMYIIAIERYVIQGREVTSWGIWHTNMHMHSRTCTHAHTRRHTRRHTTDTLTDTHTCLQVLLMAAAARRARRQQTPANG